jgi:hypothetical protein
MCGEVKSHVIMIKIAIPVAWRSPPPHLTPHPAPLSVTSITGSEIVILFILIFLHKLVQAHLSSRFRCASGVFLPFPDLPTLTVLPPSLTPKQCNLCTVS